MAIRTGFALKAERVLEIESDDRIARKFQQKKAQRAYGDAVRDLLLFLRAHAGMALLDFGQRRGLQAIDQVVGLYAEPFASADLHVGFLGVLGGEFIPHFRRASRS